MLTRRWPQPWCLPLEPHTVLRAVLKEFADSRSIEKPKLTDGDVATQYSFLYAVLLTYTPYVQGRAQTGSCRAWKGHSAV